jgi:AraC family transcriptional regulator of adaptative response/methylated-DNA-[protein]-cysteine methyltransferase
MHSDYERIAAAIRLIDQNIDSQPDLNRLAATLGLSSYYFHRLFHRWAGVTPKRFVQFLTVEYAKQLLQNSQSVLDVSYQTGLSGPGRLHDHFVALEAVTPGEYKGRGAGLKIFYGVHPSPFGKVFLATTERGVCALSFISGQQAEAEELTKLQQSWSYARLCENRALTQAFVKRIFDPVRGEDKPLTLLVRGTNFQIQIWKALLQIPPGHLCSYQQLARIVDKPTASRAVGQAIGANPIAYLIPCHRVIRRMGLPGGYRWGETRKRALIAWEASRIPDNSHQNSLEPQNL